MNEIELGKETLATKKLFKKTINEIRKYKKKQHITINNRNMTTWSYIYQPKTYAMDLPKREQYKENYNKLLYQKVNDETLKEQTIKYAEIMIQPTCYCDITMTTDNSKKIRLQVICCLPEHTQIFTNWWQDKTIDSNTLQPLVKSFENYLKKYNIASVLIVQNIQGKGKITTVENEITFT